MIETHCPTCAMLYHALEMVRASVDNLYLLRELKNHPQVTEDLRITSKFIDTTLEDVPKTQRPRGSSER